MEESKAPEDIYPQLTVNELRQCVYLFTKYIPNNNIIILSYKSFIIKNKRRIACIEFKNNNLHSTTIINGEKRVSRTFENYLSLIYCVKKIIFQLP